MSLQGHCNCNAVQITLSPQRSGEPYQTFHCRCTTCKRDSGAGGQYVTITDEDLMKVDDVEGIKRMWKDTLTDSGRPAERWSCGRCSSPLFTTTPNMPGKVVVRMGLFAEVPPVAIEIYTKRRRSWEPAIDGAVSIEGAPYPPAEKDEVME